MKLDQKHIFLWQNYLLYAIAFFIPLYPRATPALIVGFGLLSFIAIARGYNRARMSEVAIVFISIYLLHAVGMLFTENVDRGLFDLQVKLSFLAIPLAFIGFRFVNTTNFRTTLKAFLTGTVIQGVISLMQSLYHFRESQGDLHSLVSTEFSYLLHTSYFALYLVFALVIFIYLTWPVFSIRHWIRSIAYAFLMLFLAVCVLLTGSKTGMIMLAVTGLSATIALMVTMKQKWFPLLMLVVMTSVLGVILQQTDVLNERVKNLVRVSRAPDVPNTAKESTAVRVLVYQSAWQLVLEQPWYGQGTGDFQDGLNRVYEEHNYKSVLDKQLNAHNLFLQTWISHGIPGLMLIIGFFLMVFIQAFRSREWMYIGFAVLVFIIAMTESVFNVQSGVVFITFFGALLSRRVMFTSNAENYTELEEVE